MKVTYLPIQASSTRIVTAQELYDLGVVGKMLYVNYHGDDYSKYYGQSYRKIDDLHSSWIAFQNVSDPYDQWSTAILDWSIDRIAYEIEE